MPPLDTVLPPTGLADLALALVLATGLSVLTGAQYVRLGRTLTNRANLAYTFPIISLTVVLIISVAKASLALSVGLAGALSIVRFRTPVREPEELGYLFIAIGIGIGMGAGQIVATVGSVLLILGVASARSLFWGRSATRNLYLNVEVRDATTPGDQIFKQALALLAGHVQAADLRRLDVADGLLQAALYVTVKDDLALASAIESLRRDLPGSVTVTFIDQESTGISW